MRYQDEDDQPALLDDQAALLAEVRDLYALVDPVPAELVAAAEASLDWRTPGAEIAELTHDSACDPAEGGDIRGPGAGRLLAFESGEASILVEIRETGARRRILGQVSGRRPGVVQVRHPAGVHDARADALGRFRAEDVPAGPVSFACPNAHCDAASPTNPERGAQVTLVTDWVSI